MALRKLSQFAVIEPFQPPVAGVAARSFCVPKFPTVGGGGVRPGNPNPPPPNSGTPPVRGCPFITFVPPCTTNAATGQPVCTPRVVSC